jgi:hypothetical protein
MRYGLKTGYVGLAKSRARLLAGQVQEFFRMLREIITLDELTDEQTVNLVNRWFRNFVNGLEKMRVAPEAFFKGDTFRTFNQINQSVSSGAKKALADCDYSYAWPDVSAVLEREGLEVKLLSGNHNRICRELKRDVVRGITQTMSKPPFPFHQISNLN